MRVFEACYDLALKWSRHPNASKYLAGLSFSESVFFPVPPDVMLAPMSLAKPSRAWHFAFITTLASVLGGVAGYLLGLYGFECWLAPVIESAGYSSKLERAIGWFEEYGVWIVFLAGFSPIPYKIFTISAGFLHMAFLPFLLASAVGRGARFFIVAGLLKMGGPAMEVKLRSYVERLGWSVVILAVIAYFTLR